MKKQIFTQFQNGFIVLMTTALLLSCSQMETFEANDLQSDANEAAKSSFNLTPFDKGSENAKEYEDLQFEGECITASGEFYEKKDELSQSWGGNPNINPRVYENEKKVSYIAYNTPTEFVVKVLFITSTTDLATIKVKFENQPQKEEIGVASGTTSIFTFPLSTPYEDWEKVKFSIAQNGANTAIKFTDVEYLLVPVCIGCDASFTADIIKCGESNEVKFTFIADEADIYTIQGGLTAKSSNVASGNATAEMKGNNNYIISETIEIGLCGQGHSILVTWDSENEDPIFTGEWTVTNSLGVVVATLEPLICD